MASLCYLTIHTHRKLACAISQQISLCTKLCTSISLQPVAPERILKRGAGTHPLFCRVPSTCVARATQVDGHDKTAQVKLVVLVSAVVMVSTIWSVYCLLLFYSRYPPRAQPFVKVGARAPVPHGVGATDYSIIQMEWQRQQLNPNQAPFHLFSL